jgi:hypothetical protein
MYAYPSKKAPVPRLALRHSECNIESRIPASVRTTDKRLWSGIFGVSVTGVVGPGIGVVDDGGGEMGGVRVRHCTVDHVSWGGKRSNVRESRERWEVVRTPKEMISTYPS